MIDCYSHICPLKFMESFSKTKLKISWDHISPGAKVTGGSTLWDIEKRLKIISKYENYRQVLVPSCEVIEPFFDPEDTNYLIRVFNDSLFEIINRHPNIFIAAVASLPINNIDAALREIDRTINEMGFKGILMHTPVYIYREGKSKSMGLTFENQRPLDSPEFWPIFEMMSQLALPIWIHPCGRGGVPSYKDEKPGRYGLDHILGWPIESAIAMSRLVSSGILAKYPNLKFIIHHCGSAIIPVLAGRLDNEFDKLESAGRLEWGPLCTESNFKQKKVLDYFKMFYGDTALYGDTSGLECGRNFFGTEHIVFGTDYPYDMANGEKFIPKTIEAVNKMDISDSEKQMIFEGNIAQLLRL